MPIERYGSTVIAKVNGSSELRRALSDEWLKSDPLIVKPNWVEKTRGLYTDARSMRLLFEALDRRITVVEGHQIHRCHYADDPGPTFTVEGKERDWEWLKMVGWSWLTRNPDWSWFSETEHRRHIQRMDQRFRDENGFTDLFSEFGADYVNVTEEIWDQRVVDPATVKRDYEARFPPAVSDRIYGFMPAKLHAMRGSTLVSYSKLKQYATFSIKNLFGLVPDPIRAWWHGPKGERMMPSIVAINHLYESYFRVYGVVEALTATPRPDPKGTIKMGATNFSVAENLGVIATSRNRVELDDLMLEASVLPKDDTEYIRQLAETLNIQSSRGVKNRVELVKGWLR